MNRRGHRLRLDGGRQLTSLEAGCDRLQRVPRLNLRMASPVGVLTGALAGSGARLRACGFQRVEAGVIHGLERQLRLEPCLGRGVELPRVLQRLGACKIGTVAVETQETGTPGRAGGARAVGMRVVRLPESAKAA